MVIGIHCNRHQLRRYKECDCINVPCDNHSLNAVPQCMRSSPILNHACIMPPFYSCHPHAFLSVIGIGFGLMFYPTYLCLQAHFLETFPTASTISGLFEFVGIAVLPPVLQSVKERYGLGESLILYGAILWNMIVVGMCFREPARGSQQRREATSDKNQQGIPVLKFCSVFSKHRNFGILLLMEFLAYNVFLSWALFLVSLGTSSAGLSEDQAVLLSTFGGIGGFLGKISAILLFYFERMNPYTSSVIPLAIKWSLLVSMCGTDRLLSVRNFNRVEWLVSSHS